MTLDMERLKRIPNGNPARATFSKAEMARRIAGLRRIPAELDLNAAILAPCHNINDQPARRPRRTR